MEHDDISKQYLLKDIEFFNENRCYKIEFNRTKILQIMGYSATGKSLMLHDIRDRINEIEGFPNILAIDTINYREAFELLKIQGSADYDLIVIDNADVLLDKEMDDLICKALVSEKTYWIILGRTWFKCCAYMGCRAVMKHIKENRKYKFFVDYSADNN